MTAVAPLQAYTESAQRAAPKRTHAPRKAPMRRRPAGKKTSIEFDDAARQEYLTGFSKRKQARKQAAHDFVQRKIREEIRETRRAAREARKEQAAENVAAERAYYAGGDDDDEDEEEEEAGEVADVAPLSAAHEFEGDDRRAHVSVQSFDLDEPAPAPKIAAPARKAPPARKKAPEIDPSRPSGSLTSILEPEVALATQSGKLFDDEPEAPRKKEKFTYTTAAERAAERERVRRKRQKLAEKRRAQLAACSKCR